MIVIISGCANKGNPSGGEGDVTSPLFISVTPKTHSVSVPTTESIELEFNEWVQPTSITSAVTIHPTVPDGFELKTRGRTVTISPNKLFAENTTYHISINTDLTDFYTNRLEEPISLVFSTGSEIDSGVITGSVILEQDDSDTPLKVSLFLASRFDTTLDTTLLFNPDYFTQCDSIGEFSFNNINENSYRIVGFRDNNGDNLLTAGEMVFISKEQVVNTNSNNNLLLSRVSSDTTLIKITDPLFLSPNIFTVKVTPLSITSVPDKIELISTDSTNPVSFTSSNCTILSDSLTVVVRFEDSIPSNQYDMITSQKNRFTAGPFLPERDTTDEADTLPPYTVVVNDTVRFNAITTGDTTKPELLNWSIQKSETRIPELVLNWSIPVKIDGDIANAVAVEDSNGGEYVLSATSEYSSKVTVKPVDTLDQNHSLDIRVHAEKFTSFTNVHADTLDTLITMTTPQDRDIALSVLVDYINSNEFAHWKWELLTPDHSRKIPLTHTANGFYAEEVPADLYTVSLFNDINGNDVQDNGTLFPFQNGENRIFLNDTIKAKGHWKTEMMFDSEIHILRQAGPLLIESDSLSSEVE